jgi:hypothetical protein
MAHTIYDNFYLSNEVEDQFNSHLDLQKFVVVDNSLVGEPGMLRKINRYRATNATQKLTMGNGNTQSIEVSYGAREYRIAMAQNRFQYYDEQAMTDPMLVPVGVRHMGTDMFNTVNADLFGEFNKATQIIVTSALGFDAFADAVSMMNIEGTDNDPQSIFAFAFVCPSDVAALRKALKDELKYVEAFARTGYIGTVAGVNVYTKKDAVKGTIVTAVLGAVTLFNKKGTEVETPARSADEANVRLNTIFSRKYYIAALTDERKAVKIVQGTAAVSSDTSVNTSKTYYEASGLGYVEVEPEAGDNPHTKGWYEITPSF